MKTLTSSSWRTGLLLLGAAGLASFPAILPAQVAITGVSFGAAVDSANVTAGNLTFLNEVNPVLSVEAGASGTYAINGALASAVNFRRNTSAGNANATAAYYQYSSVGYYGTATVFGQGDATPTAGELMLSGNLSQGLWNPFANGTAPGESNIERIDFHFSGGYTVQTGDAVVLFDLENYGDLGDGFRIAAYTAAGTVNGVSNAPTAFATTGLLIQPNSMGAAVSTGNTTNPRWISSFTTSGNSLASGQDIQLVDSNSGTAGWSDGFLNGVLIHLSDLGLTAGQTIYGYSLMAGDVSASSANDLVNWNNTAVFRTDTDAATWGNVDFAGFGGQLARPVPEPRTYGALLLASLIVALGLRRRRPAIAAPAARC